MILRLRTYFLFNLFFLFTTCFELRKLNLPSLDREKQLKSLEDTKPIIMRLFKNIRPAHARGGIKKFTNKVLVKRIQPHDAPPTGYEYDYRFKTLFKPLIRIHKTLSDYNRGQEHTAYDYNEGKLNNVHIIKIHDDGDEALLEPFGVHHRFENIDSNRLLNIINKNRKPKARSNKSKSYNKMLHVLKDILRSPQWGRSIENNENPSHDGYYEFDDILSGNKTKSWIPHYPFWNYWTYKKPIHEDVCPEQQVKVGNMCVWFPPH